MMMKTCVILFVASLLISEAYVEVVSHEVDRVSPGGPTPCYHCLKDTPNKLDKVIRDHDMELGSEVKVYPKSWRNAPNEVTRDHDTKSNFEVKFNHKFPRHLL